MDILQCWNVSRTVCKKDFVLRAGVRVSSQYFPVLYCVSFSCARKRCATGYTIQNWTIITVTLTLARNTKSFLRTVGYPVSNFQFCIVYHSVAHEIFRGSRMIHNPSVGTGNY